MLHYHNIPTAYKEVKRKIDAQFIEFRTIRSESVWSYYLLNSASIFSALSRQLNNNDIDIIIHANILPSAIAVALGRFFHVPLMYDYQDHFPEAAAIYFKSKLGKSLVYPVISQITRFNIKHSDMIITVTNSHREIIKECAPSKPVNVIPNGVDTSLFTPIPRDKALKELSMEELSDKIILVYYGSIDPWLDFLIVFRAIKQLVKKGYDILFFIIGISHSKYYLINMKKMAREIGLEDRVFFFDPVSQNKLVYYINAANMVVAPYKFLIHNQAVPLKVLEALACGKEVSVSRIPEIYERFKGVVKTYTSEQELESNIVESIKDIEEASIDQKRATAETYSWDTITSTYYRLIEQVVTNR